MGKDIGGRMKKCFLICFFLVVFLISCSQEIEKECNLVIVKQTSADVYWNESTLSGGNDCLLGTKRLEVSVERDAEYWIDFSFYRNAELQQTVSMKLVADHNMNAIKIVETDSGFFCMVSKN